MRRLPPLLASGLVVAALVGALVQAAPRRAAPEPMATAAAAAPAARPPSPRELPGWADYDRFCLACHGAAGDGRGPAAPYLWPRPRDLTRGEAKWRSSPVGQPALDADLALTIRHGAPGTAMHGFGDVLDDAAVARLVAVVRAFAGQAPVPGAPPTVASGPGDPARGAALWRSAGCAACHGDDGRGDGPAAAALGDRAPYDLTASPLRRPRPTDDDAGRLDAAYRSIAWGLAGTAMPGSEGALPPQDLRDLAAHVDGLRPRAPLPYPGPIPAPAIAADEAGGLARAGYWPGHADAAGAEEAVPFGGSIPVQAPPAALGPAQASLSAQQCARCHAAQVRQWGDSLHARAASPGLLAQVARTASERSVESCLRCHAPLAEQQPRLRTGRWPGGDPADLPDDADTYADNPWFDPALRDEGVTCAACHVRDGVRHGPPTVSASLLPLPGYPAAPSALYERGDLCLPCHQLQPRIAVEGRPLLDTYREWLLGPYMRRGVQCQHCHMPNREHTFKGVHDPDTFRQGYRLEAMAARGATGVVTVRARMWNVGAGHMMPTTPTPAAWLEVELVDAGGRAIAGARADRRIGRHVEHDGSRWIEHEDTRIPPGGSVEVAAGFRRGDVARATHARVTVRVHPDDLYEALYRKRLRGKLAPEIRAGFEEALARALANRFVAEERLVPIAAP